MKLMVIKIVKLLQKKIYKIFFFLNLKRVLSPFMPKDDKRRISFSRKDKRTLPPPVFPPKEAGITLAYRHPLPALSMELKEL